MATNLNISENQERVPLTVGSRGVLRSITPDNGSPYYVGARAYVTQNVDGATVTVIDKDGTTTANIYNGTDGADGQDGADGADGFSPIATVSKVGDTATISITDENGTTTATVTDGTDGQDGRDGADGQDGYTPIKGVDYFDGQDGADGTDGQDGFSPIANVSKVGDTATISITDANGTTTATISDGADGQNGQDGQDGQNGQDGYSPSATVTKSGTVATITITDKDGTTTAEVYDGSGSISDVKVDGASVVTGGVAEIDLTGKSDVGHTHTKSAITDFPTLATVATSGDYDDLTDKPTIPSNVSDLVNDSGFITSPNVVYCTCGTATSTVAKVATIVSGSLPSLNTGDQAIVKFTYANSATNPTLKVGSTTAKNIKKYGSTAPGTSAASSWQANSCILFVYDGTDWQMCDWNNTTYSEISSTNIKSGSSSSTGLISGRRAKAAVEEFAPVQSVNGSTGAVTITVPTATSDLTNDSGFLNASGILNLFYPIGSYYETSDASFDPNTSWGGTWVLEAEGQVHVSAGTNYAVSGALTNVSDGGKSSVTLRAAIGAASGEPSTLNYVAAPVSAFQQARGTGSYNIYGATYNTGRGWSHSTPVTDNTSTSESTSIMQPYIVVNRWHRTA